ncbi:DNA polymerase I [Candidatus Odyssella thessalonicensis]|uniref:DNA polymerase I n=1 Tax=Candidatus Odyssella thessalonicensis TaxID=84647 RepID=UPI000225B919|nr:DNA polymerase I [Candidatus Odyssella thessalonicensis]
MTKKLILIDGSGFIFRAYHALPPLRRSDGTHVGAVYGFCTMLMRHIEQAQYDNSYLAVIFDAARETFRQEIYPDYKAHRPDVPEDLIPQFSIIREACGAFNVPSVELEGYEADDLIASYAKAAQQQGMEVVIISSDKDLMQLVRDGVTMLDPIKNKRIAEQEVFEKFGVFPNKVIDVQALAGDATDNIPGVPGIGIKTAAELINSFGSVEALLERAQEIKQPKRRQSLVDHADNARISKRLVTLCDAAPLPAEISTMVPQAPNITQLKDFMRFQGFTSLISRVDKHAGTEKKSSNSAYITIRTKEELIALVEECLQKPYIAFDTETTSLDIMEAKIVGVSLAHTSGQGYYIPINHQEATQQLDEKTAFEILQPLLTDPSVLKIGQNIKYDLGVLHKYGVKVFPITDTMLISYVLDGSRNGHGMDELAERHLNHTTIKYTDVVGTGRNQKTFDQVDIGLATSYAAEDADITLQLYEHLYPRLAQEKMLTVYERIERPLIPIIAEMELTGIRVDQQLLFKLGREFGDEMQHLERRIYELAGRAFNIGSPKQLGEVLFDELKLPAPKKTKTGSYVTDADVLEKLAASGHELPKVVLEWRELAKLKSTYADGLLNSINKKTQRIHTSYSMALTSTGRLSSSDPNLQNIPIKTAKGRQIRQAFIPAEGWKMLSLDYSQIELRLLCHMAEVPQLTQAFQQGLDIHASTASEMFGIPLDQVTADIRRKAKAINFGIIYGISAYGLSQQLDIPQSEAAHYINHYFDKYPGIQAYMEYQKDFARQHGYVKTLFGRKCYTLGIQDKNAIMRQFAERQAINAPLQGTNADIIKMAMHRIPQCLKDNNLSGRMLLQVHDELVFEVPQAELEVTTHHLKALMENITYLRVPLVIGVGIGNNWDEAH